LDTALFPLISPGLAFEALSPPQIMVTVQKKKVIFAPTPAWPLKQLSVNPLEIFLLW